MLNVEIMTTALESMRLELAKFPSRETGGVLLGRRNKEGISTYTLSYS